MMVEEKELSGVLWLVRDGDEYGKYILCSKEPKFVSPRKIWWAEQGNPYRELHLSSSQSPVELGLGKGPIEVRLVKV